MSGRYPHEVRATHNAAKWETPPAPMLGAVVSRGGYRTAWFGKWHLPIAASRTEDHGFSEVALDRGKGNDARLPEAFLEFARRSDGRPFFVVASFLNPHNICEWARAEPTPEGAIAAAPPPEACPALPENFEIPFDEPEVIRAIQARHPPGYPTTGWAPDRWRQYRWAYYRLIEKVDAQIGQLIEALERQGLRDNTAVIFSSDHGDGNASHRWNQKQVLYEEATRVPFVICAPGFEGGKVDKEYLIDAGLDLYPTVCELAGVEKPSHLRGRSVLSLMRGPAPWRTHLVCETEFANNAGGLGIFGRMVRDNRFKYICYSQGARREQLFDLVKDPGETLNLAAAPEMLATVRGLRDQLVKWAQETGDTPVMPATP